MLSGFDADLAVDENRLINRLRSVLLSVHPALERAIGAQMHRSIGPGLLAKLGGPTGFSAAADRDIDSRAKVLAPRLWTKVVDSIVGALAEQTVSVPGAAQADVVIKHLAGQLLDVRVARRDLAAHFEEALTEHPAGPILTSLPGVGVRTGVTMLVKITDIERFRDAGALAVCAGVAPRAHRSGTSIKGEHRQHSGNSRLKRTMYLSAFASLKDPVSRAYYDRKRSEGKNHRSALICLARCRSNVLYAMLRNGSEYRTVHEGGCDVRNAAA